MITRNASNEEQFESFPSYNEDKSQLTTQEKLRHFIEQLYFRLFSLILIVIDCTLVVIDISAQQSPTEKRIFNAIAMTFVSYFLLELAARVYAQT